MFYIILGAIAAIIAFLSLFKKINCIENIILSFLTGFVVFLFSFVIIYIPAASYLSTPNFDNQNKVIEETVNFSSLDFNGTEYIFTYNNDTLGIITKSIDASKCYINYISADETPYVAIWRNEPKSWFVRNFICDGNTFYTFYIINE